jgi:predicted transposase YdaD
VSSFFEDLIEDDPVVQNLLAQSERVGRAKGKIKGRIEELKKLILDFLRIRFSPVLADEARSVVMAIQAYETLEVLFRGLIITSDERTVRIVIGLPYE